MSPSEPLPPAMRIRIAEQFKALAEPVRLSILSALFDGPKSVGELAEETGASIANVSKHLGVLARAGWIAREKVGTTVRCALADERTAALCELMCARVRERAQGEAELLAPAPRRKAARPRAR